MIYLETSRLQLRDWKEDDLEPFCRLNADAEVMRYFPKTMSAEETAALQRTFVSELNECGFGRYAVQLKESERFIGFIGFHRAAFEADFTPCIEIGWRLDKAAWGKGYATEGAAACLHYGWEQLGFSDVYSFTAVLNAPSENVMKKIGMQFVKTFNHPKVDPTSPLYPHVLYHTSRK